MREIVQNGSAGCTIFEAVWSGARGAYPVFLTFRPIFLWVSAPLPAILFASALYPVSCFVRLVVLFCGNVSKKNAVPSQKVILLCVMTLFRGDTISKNSVENPVKHKGTRGNRPSQKTKLEAAASSRADQLETSFRTERNPSAKKTTQNFPIPAFQSPRRVQQESSLSVENSISKAGRSKEKQQKWYHQKNRK